MKDKEKLLFVTFHNIIDASFGGAQCSQRNYLILSEIFEVEIYSILKRSNIQSLISGLELNYPPILNLDKRNIINLLEVKKIDNVFFDNSLMGSLVVEVKKIECKKVIVFFHNVEIDYIDVRFGENKIRYFYKYLAELNERRSAKYSNSLICLNSRDKFRIKEIYNKDVIIDIPITFKNSISTSDLIKKYNEIKSTEEKVCLFVGAFSNSNYEGIKWFIDNVAKKIHSKILIVGKGFEDKKVELSYDNVEIIGFVDNLEYYYLISDCVISPLLSGGGMKVKIAEALMYGKTIFGTKEAFQGYDVNYKNVGGICNNAEEFISEIENYLKNSTKYNEYSRRIFVEKYTHETALRLFLQLVKDKLIL